MGAVDGWYSRHYGLLSHEAQMSSSLCYNKGKMVARSRVCRSLSSLIGSTDTVEKTSCLGDGVSPVLVGIITALATALVTGLVVMAVMRLACGPDTWVDGAGKREA